MSVYTSISGNVLSQIKQIWIIFTHLKFWVAVARHNFNCLKILIRQPLAIEWLKSGIDSRGRHEDPAIPLDTGRDL